MRSAIAPTSKRQDAPPAHRPSSPTASLQNEVVAQSPFVTAQRAQLAETFGTTLQRKPNKTGLPDTLKSGIESLSGMSLDSVRVHYNSDRPAQLNAHAYAQGTDIHLAQGQEKHLPHEAWHVVQQAQGRVKPTMQMKSGTPVNDDKSLEHEADHMGTMASVLEDEEHVTQGRFRNPPASSHRGIVQRKGVKEQLREAETTFIDFMRETEQINDTRTEVANAIYNSYKLDAGVARKKFDDKVAHQGVNPNFDSNVALEKATRMKNWTLTSVNAASRIYQELIAATNYNDDHGIGLENITFGNDTTKEPDVYPTNYVAMEVKRIDSGSQGSVDGHIKKVSEQLEKRVNNNVFVKSLTTFVAHIAIDNPENPWPYTPVALTRAVKSKKLNVLAVGLKRIKQHENSSKIIHYKIVSKNPNIGEFSVDV